MMAIAQKKIQKARRALSGVALKKWMAEEGRREEIDRRAAAFGKNNVRAQDTHKTTVNVGGIRYEVDAVKTGYYKLWERGRISDASFNAAALFELEFRRAGYDRIKTTNLTGAGGGGRGIEDVYADSIKARDYVSSVLKMLGGPCNLMARSVVSFVGCGQSVAVIAASSETDSRHFWTGVLISALQLMGDDYDRMTRGKRSRSRFEAFVSEYPTGLPGQ